MALVLAHTDVVSTPGPASGGLAIPTLYFTFPSIITALHGVYVASAKVGTRTPQFVYQDPAGATLAEIVLSPTVTAGQTIKYNLIQIPQITMQAGSAIYFTDTAAISSTTTAATGVATATSSTTLTDSTQAWTVNQWVGYVVEFGSALAVVTSNTATALTAAGGWSTLVAGTAEASDATTLTDSDAAWTVNEWVGYLVHMDTSVAYITSNTDTVLTFVSGWDVATPATGAYYLFGMGYALTGDVVTATAAVDVLSMAVI